MSKETDGEDPEAGGDVEGGDLHSVADFDSFYRREYAAVVWLAFALTGRYELAEEFAQDAFVAAHRRWARISGYEDPAGWVRRVATNRCISGFRRVRTELRVMARLRETPPQAAGGADPDARVWAAVRSLPRRQAQVLALMFIEDRTTAEVARLLGCSEETVRTHSRRGRHSLARRLGLAEEEP